jgi:hypothetical protein
MRQLCGISVASLRDEEKDMLNTLKAALVAVTALSASMAHAGGPVIIEEGNDALIAENPGSRIGILPVIGALVLICLIACGGGDDPTPAPEPDEEPDPDTKT